jgi:Zn-dependent protease with chaperone function
MRRGRRCFLVLLLPLLLGCAGVSYRDRAALSHTRYATVENFGDEVITAEQVDGLLEEVAQILGVALQPGKPKVRIIVTPPSRIADLNRRAAAFPRHGADAVALYFPGANLIAIPYYDRAILGHELAHFLTDQYLRETPRRHWERLAHMVEDRLPREAPVLARVPVTGMAVASRGRDVLDPMAPAN